MDVHKASIRTCYLRRQNDARKSFFLPNIQSIKYRVTRLVLEAKLASYKPVRTVREEAAVYYIVYLRSYLVRVGKSGSGSSI